MRDHFSVAERAILMAGFTYYEPWSAGLIIKPLHHSSEIVKLTYVFLKQEICHDMVKLGSYGPELIWHFVSKLDKNTQLSLGVKNYT